jgi:hypothetical protein
VTIKDNKIFDQWKAITLQEWSMNRKYEQIIKNELMNHIQGKEVPSKKKVPSYLYKEWEDLTIKKNFTNDVIVKHSSGSCNP